jgi:CubicO group peptidase (beta-lactamase class C family)
MGPAWQARHGLTVAQLQTELDTLVNQGFRPIDLNGYSVNGVDRYAGVWEQSPGPAWIARQGVSVADHQALLTSLPQQGFRPVAVSGYEVGGEVRFASLWQQIADPEWHARHGLTAAELQAELDALVPQGFRPVDVCGYRVGGQVRFAAIWERVPAPEWVVRHSLTAGEYRSHFDHLAEQGFVPWRVSGYDDGTQTRYAVIWNKGPALTWQERHGLAVAAYQAEFDALRALGYRLVKVNGFPAGAQATFSTIWYKPYLSDADERLIRQTVTTFMSKHDVPGVSLALTRHGRLVFAQGYGVTDPTTGQAVGTGHLFRIASVSKPITATTVFRLMDAGQLNLGDRIFGANGILGTRFGTQPYGPNIDRITVQHLLEHTSGWPRARDPMFTQFNLNQAQLIDWMIDNVALANPPGSTFDYLNFGYLVLGRVIEEVTGLPYEDAVRRHVLAPCGIVDMHIAGDTLADRRANEVVYTPQSRANPYAIRVSRMDAHGGWIASPTDLMRFLVRVDGFASKPDILTAGSIATMATPTTAPMTDGTTTGYAKGWATNAAGNRWHAGDIPGSASILVRTASHFGWAVLCNSRDDAWLDQMRIDLDNLMWTVVGRITDWPARDLF